jgi:hypothetical protein
VRVADPLHAEAEQRLEIDHLARPAAFVQRDRRALRAARARDVGDLLLEARERLGRRVLDARESSAGSS